MIMKTILTNILQGGCLEYVGENAKRSYWKCRFSDVKGAVT